MKKLSLLLLLAVLVGAFSGCSRSAPVEPDPPECPSECPYCGYSWQREDFAGHLYMLADDPEDCVDVGLKYNRTKDLEDAFTKLCGFTSKDWYVSTNDAEDAWIYVSHYIDALHAEIDELYREYQDAY